jgi:hypothetical protein
MAMATLVSTISVGMNKAQKSKVCASGNSRPQSYLETILHFDPDPSLWGHRIACFGAAGDDPLPFQSAADRETSVE